MPEDSRHPLYTENLPSWKKCRACSEGEEAVKAARDDYLPRLEDQSEDEYDAYKARASFYAATSRTIKGITGIVFRKPPQLEGADQKLQDALSTIGADGSPFEVVCKQVFSEVMTVGRHGVLLDLGPDAPPDAIPYWAQYRAESIINWKTQRDENGDEQLIRLVLEEKNFEEKEDDPFELELITRYRVLELIEGTYNVSVYRKTTVKRDGREQEEMVPEQENVIPSIRGNSLQFIPFVFFNPQSPTASLERPPILDLVNINLSHYRNSADLEHGLHYTALPTAWVSGFRMAEDSGRLRIGSQVAWVSEDPGASAGFLEFSGAGLAAIERSMDRKESQMAILGARMLEEPKRAVEAADTHALRVMGERSITATTAMSIESGIRKLFEMMGEWSGAAVPDLSFNTEFNVLPVDSATLTMLFEMLQNGKISYETFFWNMKRADLLPKERTMEEEIEKVALLAGTPFGSAAGLDDYTNEGEGGEENGMLEEGQEEEGEVAPPTE